MKFLAYTVAWALVISQWNDLYAYSYNPITPAPIGGVIITILATVILLVATFKELTKKGKK
ncbi:hypothetical protein [Weissella confusa]|uniref:hypothetical protein n=1 Tax=Weissella confusa TaxID=1583 RepID=UPI0018F23CC4|nr:hypothetical protein [Weissella confusa]MBJ7691487.1 hypothetical protein [Weissella confusa]MBJ7697724.1 hypothetical protein [Weissella confusa]MBJ7701744.1 hypothetical protein [Weissella confusa]